ncbi:MAG: FAD:protein FMN transferase [Streptosporangiaceae bacterium]
MNGQPLATEEFAVFGTTAVLIVTDAGALPDARRIADAELAAVDAACSRFRPDSELSRLNAAGGRPRPVSDLFATLIATAIRAADLTGGAVDPTCGRALLAAGYDRDFSALRADNPDGDNGSGGPTPVPGWRAIRLDRRSGVARLDPGVLIDLGATAKAWAADRCAARIAASLGCGVLVSLGGDLAVAGPAPSGGWPIRVTDDHAAGSTAPGQSIAIASGGLATSSTTVRSWRRRGQPMHHVIDPATGSPARSRWRTASVAAATCADANIASTAAIVKSDRAAAWLESLHLPARLVATDGTVRLTADWPSPAS